LCGYLRRRLRDLPHLRPLTPKQPELSGAILTCALDEGRNSDIVNRLRTEHRIMIKPAQGTYAFCPDAGLQRENYNALRFSTHIFNHESQIDRTVEALGTILAKL
jgi:selenocysteine lyase/cysteine desulfurase